MIRKRWFTALAAGVLVLCLGVTANAGTFESVRVYVNEKPIGEEAKIINGRIYLPVDSVCKSLDVNSKWNPETNSLSLNSSQTSIAAIIEKLGPSVVGIIGKIKQSSRDYSTVGDNLAFGSGIVYKANGYIITNAHVVKDLENIIVVLSNGKAYQGKLKAMDEKSDLAMVKIDKGGLTPVEFGQMSDIVVGDDVIAIGTPLSMSLRNSATKGIISGLNRSTDGEYRYIQSDAAINGGNSGGPLVNMQGKVIGINSMKFAGLGIEGVSFSIPIDTVKYVISHFEKYGRVKRPYLGALYTESIEAKYGLPTGEGLTITEIKKDSPAEKVDLKVDDEITFVNNVKVSTIIEFSEEMKKYLPGDCVELTYMRNGTASKVKVTFEEVKE